MISHGERAEPAALCPTENISQCREAVSRVYRMHMQIDLDSPRFHQVSPIFNLSEIPTKTHLDSLSIILFRQNVQNLGCISLWGQGPPYVILNEVKNLVRAGKETLHYVQGDIRPRTEMHPESTVL